MNKKDEKWCAEILRIEKEQPKKARHYPENSPLNNDSLTEEQIDDYFMIDDRLDYLRFIRNHKNELSESSFLWLYEDLPFSVNEEFRVTYEDLEKRA